jgi:hypothetical protein
VSNQKHLFIPPLSAADRGAVKVIQSAAGPDPKAQSAAGPVNVSAAGPDPKAQSAAGPVNVSAAGPDPKAQSAADPVNVSAAGPDPKAQSAADPVNVSAAGVVTAAGTGTTVGGPGRTATSVVTIIGKPSVICFWSGLT